MKNSTLKSLVVLMASLFAGWSAFGQMAITITADDMPVPTDQYNFDNISGLAPAPTFGSSISWDYSGYFGNSPDFGLFLPESIPFFTDAGIDVYRLTFKFLNPNFGYEIYQEYDFNEDGIDDSGMDIVEQNNTLQPFTGNINDSIFIPSQSYVYNVPKRLVSFPFTANSAWTSNSRRTTDMIINVPAFGLNYASLTHAFTWVRTDTIVGWGRMKVYTADGPSIEYDVLMDKSADYAIDSFYLNGVPAPAALLSAFGVSQGQITQQNHRYTYYRKGTWAYLLGYLYGADNTYTTPVNVFVNTDNIETAPPSAVVEKITYATVLYPNPTTGSELNIKLVGGEFELDSYEVYDAFGKLAKQGKLEANRSEFKVRMKELLPTGNYYIQLKDKGLRNVSTQQFEVLN